MTHIILYEDNHTVQNYSLISITLKHIKKGEKSYMLNNLYTFSIFLFQLLHIFQVFYNILDITLTRREVTHNEFWRKKPDTKDSLLQIKAT